MFWLGKVACSPDCLVESGLVCDGTPVSEHKEGEEDEMLKQAIAMSLEEQSRVSVKEEEEEMLARGLALSMVESRISVEEEESEV